MDPHSLQPRQRRREGNQQQCKASREAEGASRESSDHLPLMGHSRDGYFYSIAYLAELPLIGMYLYFYKWRPLCIFVFSETGRLMRLY
jgi:hypothetical protein